MDKSKYGGNEMIWIIYMCGIFMALCIYMLFRNDWTYKICLEMNEIVYKYNMSLIENGTYKNNNISYDLIPTYNFILYYKFYNWDKFYFKTLLDKNVRTYEKSTI